MSDTLIKQVPEGTVTGSTGAYPYLNQVGQIVSGSVGGSLTVWTPFHGPALEMVIIYLDAFNDAGTDITFAYPFTDVPIASGTSAVTGLSPTLDNDGVNFGSTSGAKTGYYILIGNSAA